MEPTPLTQVISLTSKTAIVTGGAMGIGYGIAYRLAEAGASVVIADLDEPAARAAAEALTAKGWKATAVAVDVADAAQVQHLVDTTVATYGGVDILVNNAGIYPNKPAMQMDAATFDRILAINLKGSFFCTQAAAAHMITQGRGGAIINVTSIDATHPSSIGLAAYDASKHGLWGFTKNVALELAPHRIRVNAVAPGGVATPGAGMGGTTDPQMEERIKPFLAKIPMQRLGIPDDIGKVVLFLASDLASYMTGSQVIVDGGVLLS
jgi:2-dehydro-3-deoxy-D-gluconate 5-dehydrogenase